MFTVYAVAFRPYAWLHLSWGARSDSQLRHTTLLFYRTEEDMLSAQPAPGVDGAARVEWYRTLAPGRRFGGRLGMVHRVLACRVGAV